MIGYLGVTSAKQFRKLVSVKFGVVTLCIASKLPGCLLSGMGNIWSGLIPVEALNKVMLCHLSFSFYASKD